MSKRIRIVVVMMAAATLLSCITGFESYRISDSVNLLVPLGRSSVPSFETEILVDSVPYAYKTITDPYGNSWAAVIVNDLEKSSELIVQYCIRRMETASYPDTSSGGTTWLETNYFIDWDNPAVIETLDKLNSTLSVQSWTGVSDTDRSGDVLSRIDRDEAVKLIGAYVSELLTFDMGFSSNPASLPASKSIREKVGVCINFSRVFIALCRASGIPARSVSGIVRNYSDATSYDFHHEWMEYLDEKGYWHPLDLTYLVDYDLNDARYAGFVYGAEDHEWFSALRNNSLKSGQPVLLENGDIVLFHYHPIYPGSRYGFELLESTPEQYLIQKTMTLEKHGGSLSVTASRSILGQ